MLIVALVLAVIGLAALVTAVVTSNEVIAWVCIGASALGVLLLIVDAIRDRKQRRLEALDASAETQTIDAVVTGSAVAAGSATVVIGADNAQAEVVDGISDEDAEDYYGNDEPEADDDLTEQAEGEDLAAEIDDEEHPDEVVHEEPEFDTYSDDEPDFPEPAEEAALHTVVIDEADETLSDEAVVTNPAEDADDAGDVDLDTLDEERPS